MVQPNEHTQIRVDETLDTSGLLCPLPVYQASLVLKRMEPGRVLEVVCTDRGSLADFPALARRTGNALLGVEDRGDTQVFWLEKAEA
jgi:tRNA 2-thiouridine synthesizing protein A